MNVLVRCRVAGLALVAGAGAGATAIALWLLVDGITVLVTGPGRTPGGSGLWIGPLCLGCAPVLGGLGYGLLVHRLAPDTRGLGIPGVLLAVAGDGRVDLRAAAVRTISAGLCLGTGGSLGREGPAVVAGSAIGSLLGRRAGVSVGSVRLLVGCGTAAATAAIFDAPVTGVVFALELFLARPLLAADPAGTAAVLRGLAVLAGGDALARERTSRSWGGRARVLELGHACALLTVSACVATILRRSVLGVEPPIGPSSVPPELGPVFGLGVAGLGVAGGLVGAAFGVLIHITQHAADRVWRGPPWLRPAAGGVLLGPLLLALPQLYGVGNTVVGQVVASVFPLALLLALTVGKIVAVCLTLAVGGVGGVFAPLLFVGATLGAAWGTATGHWFSIDRSCAESTNARRMNLCREPAVGAVPCAGR